MDGLEHFSYQTLSCLLPSFFCSSASFSSFSFTFLHVRPRPVPYPSRRTTATPGHLASQHPKSTYAMAPSLQARALAFLVLLFCLFTSSAHAQNHTFDATLPGNGGKEFSITVDNVIVGIVLIAAGFLFAFFGHKFFKITLFLAGFFTFSILVWLALAHLEPKQGYGSNADWIYLGAGAAGGLIGGCLFLCFWRLGFAAIGGVAGFALAMFILSWTSAGVISYGTGRIIFIVACVLVGILLTFFVERHIVILGTALVGAGAFFVGLDFFLHTGYKEAFRAFLSGNHSALFGGYHVSGKVYGMLAGNLGMTIVGAAFQYWRHHDSFVPKSHRPHANRPSYQEV